MTLQYMIEIDVKYIWAKRLNSILKTWFFTTVQTFKLDFLENMKSADGTFLQATVDIYKRLGRRQFDPLIIERTIGLVLGPSTALYRPFLERCTFDLQGGWDYMMGLVQTSSEATRSWSSSPLIVSRDSFSHQTWARFHTGGA